MKGKKRPGDATGIVSLIDPDHVAALFFLSTFSSPRMVIFFGDVAAFHGHKKLPTGLLPSPALVGGGLWSAASRSEAAKCLLLSASVVYLQQRDARCACAWPDLLAFAVMAGTFKQSRVVIAAVGGSHRVNSRVQGVLTKQVHVSLVPCYARL